MVNKNRDIDLFVRHLHEFVRLQKKLSEAKNLYEDNGTKASSHDNDGEVLLNDQKWTFTFHGAGTRYENLENGIVVDMFYDGFPDDLDDCRLAFYFCSMGKKGVKLLRRITKSQKDAVTMTSLILEELLKSGVLKINNRPLAPRDSIYNLVGCITKKGVSVESTRG